MLVVVLGRCWWWFYGGVGGSFREVLVLARF